MFYNRDIRSALQRYTKFPVVVVLGPRQSGKTTLVKEFFKKHTYVNLEDPATYDFITTDPKKFLREYENEHGIIIDEFQHAPEFLSYIQLLVDEKDRPGYFVLTGSQNFLMNQAVTQSLAGRAGILHLLPLSIHEFVANGLASVGVDELLVSGCYPRLHLKQFSPRDFFPSYIQTYVERDVRQLLNVENIATFQKFMRLCAGRVGQELNILDIATNCGISRKVADQWLSLLQASYVIFLLKPYFNNFNKRVIKKPKLYFYDTGLACSLLGIRSAQELSSSVFRGPLFECFIVADFYKQFYNAGTEPSLYFWRDQNGRIEIDCLIDIGLTLTPIEIKSGETIVNDFFDNMVKWSEIAKVDPQNGKIVYAGSATQKRSRGHIIGWQRAGTIVHDLENV